VSSDPPAAVDVTAAETSAAPNGGSNRIRNLGILVVAVIVLDVVAFLFAPPFPRGGAPGDECSYPVCFINGTLEFPPPHVVWQLDPSNPLPTGQLVIGFNVSITNTIVTMWIVMAVVLALAILATRAMRDVPSGLQNLVEFAYQTLHDFAIGLGGSGAARFVPIYAAFFLLILFCNWSGLIPPVGRIEELRAPTSDVNITIGLALVSFLFFQLQGFRANGIGGYLSKFFPFYEFKHGVGAGLIALFVGLVELMLEFVKPVTLSMRLFGNIYGGEVALGVLTALTIGLIPIFMYSLELLLTTVQALIFSVLTLMFTLAAVESHHQEEGELGDEAAHGGSAQHPVDNPAAA
jgi:F-type H+-transporting ATPase subunit a